MARGEFRDLELLRPISPAGCCVCLPHTGGASELESSVLTAADPGLTTPWPFIHKCNVQAY